MRLVRVREVIGIAAIITGRTESDFAAFPPNHVPIVDWMFATILVARTHCAAADVARVFGVSNALTMAVEQIALSPDGPPGVEQLAAQLHRAVVNLKAARRRSLAMRRWRATQTPATIVRGPWKRAPIARGPRPDPATRKSFWTVETPAPVGAERHAA